MGNWKPGDTRHVEKGGNGEQGTGNGRESGFGIRKPGTGPQKGVRNLFSASALVSRVYEILQTKFAGIFSVGKPRNLGTPVAVK
jgi:hypothetical protein